MGAKELIILSRQSKDLTDEIKSHLTFTKVDSVEDDSWDDASAPTRKAIADILYGTATSDDLPLLHYLIQQEAIYCGEIWASTHTLSIIARTLFYVGSFSSLPILWKCKNTSFDTYAVIGSPEMLGAGIDATLDYLKHADFPEKQDILNYLQEELSTKPIREIVDKLSQRMKKKFSNE